MSSKTRISLIPHPNPCSPYLNSTYWKHPTEDPGEDTSRKGGDNTNQISDIFQGDGTDTISEASEAIPSTSLLLHSRTNVVI